MLHSLPSTKTKRTKRALSLGELLSFCDDTDADRASVKRITRVGPSTIISAGRRRNEGDKAGKEKRVERLIPSV